MAATLYSLSISHPGHAARLMLEHKGIDHRVVDLLPGMHPVLLRGFGFRGGTVPALRIDGRRIQGSLRISRALDEIQPHPPLFPADRRAAVEEAEAWGERELQQVPRLVARWGAANRREVRRWIARGEGLPAANLLADANMPIARVMAHKAGADDEGVRSMLARLPGLLDRVDALIAEGTIAGAEPNAADFQILTTVRSVAEMEDLRPYLEGRPCDAAARALWPDTGIRAFPKVLPEGWAQAPATSQATA